MDLEEPPFFTLSVSPVLITQGIANANGRLLSRNQTGLEGRLLFYPSESLGFGVAFLRTEKQLDIGGGRFAFSYDLEQNYLLLTTRFVLTPSAAPKLYLSADLGLLETKMTVPRARSVKVVAPVISAGFGMDIALVSFLDLELEVRGVYNASRELNSNLFLQSSVSVHAAAGLVWHF